AEGRFSINADPGQVLVFSFVEFESQEIRIDKELDLNITLTASASGLNQVVVVGYGKQRRRDITTAVSDVDLSKLQDVAGTNVSRLLSGQAAGVVAKQNSGKPGQEFNVKIRGMSSLGASSDPIYVVDGFVVGTSIGQNLNPND